MLYFRILFRLHRYSARIEMRDSSSLPITMPSNKELSQLDKDELENGGDVKPDTKQRRKKAAEDFSNYLTMKTGFDLEYFVGDKNNGSARDLFTETLGHYLWS